MTSLSLLTWIALGLALQLAIAAGVAFRGHWLRYAGLRRQSDAGAPGPAPMPDESEQAPLPPAWNGLRPLVVERKVIEDGAGTVCSFHLVPQDGKPLPGFLPGQFLTFNLELPAPGGGSEKIVRCYSLSDAPGRAHYRISVKRVPGGRSSNHLHDNVRVGDVLLARAPGGHFHLAPGEAPVVLIAGGIGITPMLSMLDWCLAEQSQREIWLFYGVREGDELVMAEHLEHLAAAHPRFHLRLCFSAARPEDLTGTSRRRGRVDLDRLRLELPLKPYHFYICGPTPMMENLVPALEEWGVPPSRIHYEAFGPASIRRRPPVAAGNAGDITVGFARSGKTLAWQPDCASLLEFAEANGVVVESGCRAGGCGSCQTTIRSGEVAYRRQPDFDPEPGTCLMCLGVPKTSVVLDA